MYVIIKVTLALTPTRCFINKSTFIAQSRLLIIPNEHKALWPTVGWRISAQPRMLESY